MLIINIKKDYYAYLSVDINDNGKLFLIRLKKVLLVQKKCTIIYIECMKHEQKYFMV